MSDPKIFHTDSFTRGGQIFSHEWRMRIQNLKVVMGLSLLIAFISLIGAMIISDQPLWMWGEFWALTYVWGHIKVTFWPFIKGPLLWVLDDTLPHMTQAKIRVIANTESHHLLTTFIHPTMGKMVMPTVKFFKHPWVIKHASILNGYALGALSLWGLSLFGIGYGFHQKSKNLENTKILKGKQIVEARDVRKIIEKKKLSSTYKLIPDLPLVKKSEVEHMMIMGSTGSGKTNALFGLLNQLRDQNQKAIIVDTTCGFVNRYYDESMGDIILNPFDTRSACWNLWGDYKITSEFDELAAAIIPASQSPGKDSVWYLNAREIISATAEKLALLGNPSIKSLVEYASWKSLDEVKYFYKNTPVEGLMCGQGKAAETVHSVRMQMTAEMKRLMMLPQEGKPFSITDWVMDDSNSSWLFISCKEDERKTADFFIKLWVDLAIYSLQKRGEDPNYRLWFLLDELFSLEKGAVNNLFPLLREGRKYGGCAILGFQSLSGFQKVYGFSSMKEAVSLCNTKVLLKVGEPDEASYLSKSLEQQEVIEFNESLSMGANQVRDGVNMTNQRKMRPVVSASDLQGLPKYQGYVYLPNDLPLCRIKFPHNDVPLKYKQEDYQRRVSLLSLNSSNNHEGILNMKEEIL